jgi:hypothetical protein
METFKVDEAQELELLKERADLMNIAYHPNIGVETLRRKINAALVDMSDKSLDQYTSQEYQEAYTAKDLEQYANPSKLIKKANIPETEQQRNDRIRKEAMRLIRIKITCMNPNKKDWPGEIIDTGNSIVGSIKKYVPFNTNEPYHVPYMIYTALVNRQFQSHYRVKDERGMEINKTRLVDEFAISVLEPLTAEELQELKTKQAMSHSITAA